MLFDAEQVAVGRGDIGADQHGLAGLENLVVGADADGGEILLVVEAACRGDGLVQDVVDRAQGQRIVEEVAEQFLDAAEGAMADEGETEDELSEPGFGDGQPEEELRRVGGRGVEGLVEGVVGVVELLVDEFAADLMLVGELVMGCPARASRASCWRACGVSKRAGVGSMVAATSGLDRMHMPGTPWDQERL